MFRKIFLYCSVALFVLGMVTSAQAYSGQTTDKTYKTGSTAAKATAAYYMNKAKLPGSSKIWHSSDMVITKKGKTPAGKTTSNWRLVTKQQTALHYPVATVTVKVKKLTPKKWKGYTDGKNNVALLK